MITKVNEMGDIKPYVKQGFFDYRKIEEIFTRSFNYAYVQNILRSDANKHEANNVE